MVKYGRSHSAHGKVKLTVSQEGIDGMNWFFACYYKLRKAKSNFSSFWVREIKNDHGE